MAAKGENMTGMGTVAEGLLMTGMTGTAAMEQRSHSRLPLILTRAVRCKLQAVLRAAGVGESSQESCRQRGQSLLFQLS